MCVLLIVPFLKKTYKIVFEDGMCFTDVYFGMYATGKGKKCTTPADFDWFEYSTEEGL